MADRRRSSKNESPRRKRRESTRESTRGASSMIVEEPLDMGPQYASPSTFLRPSRSGASYVPSPSFANEASYDRGVYRVSSSSSSSSSSYIDISRAFPAKRPRGLGAIRTFFTTPPEHRRRLHRRKSKRTLNLGGKNSSSSSINSDLAYGTGFIKRRKGERRRSLEGGRKKKDKRKESLGGGRFDDDPDAKILAVGAGLAELARKQNRMDLLDGRKSGIFPMRREDSGRLRGPESSRGLGSSKIEHKADDEGWYSDDSGSDDSSVDSKLAYGGSTTNFFGFGGKKPQPTRKSSVVDPNMFGPQNSLHGIINRPVGFDEVDYGNLSDYPPPTVAETVRLDRRTSRPTESVVSGSSSLQNVYPIPTSDPTRFDVAKSSVVSLERTPYTSRPDPVPLQHPKPITPVSQSVYDHSQTVTSSGRTKSSTSIAGAALAGVAGAAIGAAVVGERREKDRRRDDDRDRYDQDRDRRKEDRRERRSTQDYEAEKRSSRRHDERNEPIIIEDKERRRERRVDKYRDDVDEPTREKRREKRYAEERNEPREDKRESRRQSDRYNDHSNDKEIRREVNVSTGVDPFQYLVGDDAFPTPEAGKGLDTFTDVKRVPSPAVVTVERIPHFARTDAPKDKPSPVIDDARRRERDHESRDRRRTEKEAESTLDEVEHFTAPIAAAAIGAAIGAEKEAEHRRSREDKERRRRRDEDEDPSYRRKEERRSKDDSPPRQKRDPVQEQADRIYREAVLARKIASKKNEDDPVVKIITPPEMEHKPGPSPYDAPNADFRLDYEMDPVEFQVFTPIVEPGQYPLPKSLVTVEDEYVKANKRPLLTLVRPTPAPSPTPEKQGDQVEPKTSAEKHDPSESTKNDTSDVNTSSTRDATQTPVSSSSAKAVTWGQNETKHYEVESPQEHKDEFIESKPKSVEDREDSKPKKQSRWGAVRGAFVGAGAASTVVAAAAAATAAESSKPEKNSRPEKDVGKPEAYEYRGIVVEPELSDDEKARGPPAVGPKPPSPQSARPLPSTTSKQASHMPGSFGDDLDFTATVAAGLQDSGFDPNIVINDPKYHRRSSPPGSNEETPGLYRQPYAETVSDLGHFPDQPIEKNKSVVLAPIKDVGASKELRSNAEVEPEDEFVTKLTKKEQRKRDKAAKRQSTDDGQDMLPAEETVTATTVQEPEFFSDPAKSKKEKKKSKRSSKSFDDEVDQRTEEDERRVSVPIDAYDDLLKDNREPETAAIDDWDETPSKKSKKKSKRDSESFDSPSRSMSISSLPEETSSSKKSKDKSRRKSEQYDLEPDPADIMLPASEVSSRSDESRKSRKSSKRDSSIPDDRSIRSEPIRDDEYESRKSRKSSKRDSSIPDDRSVISEPIRDDEYESRKSRKSSKRDSSIPDDRSEKSSQVSSKYDDEDESRSSRKKEKEKDKKNGGFFGLFGSSTSKSEPEATKDDFEEPKKKKKSKRSSTVDSDTFVDARSTTSSNGNGYEKYIDNEDSNKSTNGDRSRAVNEDETDNTDKNSFLGNAGTLGAGVGLAGAVALAAQHQHAKAAQADDKGVNVVNPFQYQVDDDAFRTPEASKRTDPFSDGKETSNIPTAQSAPVKEIGNQDVYEIPASVQDTVDPEISQRQIRPAIDPQFGDLLPLPPSDPGSPDLGTLVDLPSLPESRPNSPPRADPFTPRDRPAVLSRRSDHHNPVKSPSASAVPIKFMLGHRSTPSSPRVAGPSPMASPAAASPETMTFPNSRPRVRPTSWDNTKEIQPLLLLNPSRRRESDVQEKPNVSQLAVENHPISTRVDSSDLNVTREPNKTVVQSSATDIHEGNYHPILQEASSHDDINSEQYGVSDLPPLPPSRNSTPGLESSHQSRSLASAAITGSALGLGAAVLASSLTKHGEEDTDGPPSKDVIEELPRPSPVESVTKDRTSYLFQSTPPTKRFGDIDSSPVERAEQERSTSPIAENETTHGDPFGVPQMTPTKAPSSEHKDNLTASGHSDPTGDTTNVQGPIDRDFSAMTIANLEKPGLTQEVSVELDKELGSINDRLPPLDETTSLQTVHTSISQKVDTTEDFFTKSKKGKKTKKKQTIDQLLAEDESVSTSSAPIESTKGNETSKEYLPIKSEKGQNKDGENAYNQPIVDEEPSREEVTPVIADDLSRDIGPSEEYSMAKSNKEKKKGEKRFAELLEEAEGSQSIESPLLEEPAAKEVEPEYEFAMPKSKKDKKKGKKRASEQFEEIETVSTNTVLLPEEDETAKELDPSDEFSMPKSKKDRKKDKKGRKSEEPDIASSSNFLPPPEDFLPPPVEDAGELPTPKSKRKDKKKDKRQRPKEQEEESESLSSSTILRDPEVENPKNDEPAEEHSTESQEGKENGTNRAGLHNIDEELSAAMPHKMIDPPVEKQDAENVGNDVIAEQIEELSFSNSKNDKKKDKKNRKSLSRTSTKDDVDFSEPATSEDTLQEDASVFTEAHSSGTHAVEGFVSNKYPEPEPLSEQLSSTQESAANPIEVANEFSMSKSKKDKKKAKKNRNSSQAWESEEPIIHDAAPEPLAEPVAAEDASFVISASKKKGKKGKRNLIAWDAADEAASAASQDPAALEMVADPSTQDYEPSDPLPSNIAIETDRELDIKPETPLNVKPIDTTPTDSEPFGTARSTFSNTEYFPSATSLHSPRRGNMTGHENEKDYFPSAGALLSSTVAGATVAVSADSHETKEDKKHVSKTTAADLPINTTDNAFDSEPSPSNSDHAAAAMTIDQDKASGPEAVTAHEAPDRLLKGRQHSIGGYFPSDASLHSPRKSEDRENMAEQGYFPSSAALLPVVAGSNRATTTKSSDPDVSLEERDKVEQTTIMEAIENRPLTKGPLDEVRISSVPPNEDITSSSSSAVKSVEKPVDATIPAGYSEEQLEAARQMKSDFESGVLGRKKSKKGKKGRPDLSRTSTIDDDVGEPVPSYMAEQEDQARGMDETSGAPGSDSKDGLAAGFNAEQILLAKQLQAEFGYGDKKPKKGKKSRSTSRTPNEDFGSPLLSSEYSQVVETDQFNDVSNPAESTIGGSPAQKAPDGLAAGFTPEQLEAARQMREDFSSGAMKSKKELKKDKKRQSLLRTVTDDNLDKTADSAPDQTSFSPSEANSPTDSGASTPNIREELDEFAFAPKRGKKGKKRQSSLMRTSTLDDEISVDVAAESKGETSTFRTDSVEPTFNQPIEDEPEPETVEPGEEEFSLSKKSRKDKKNKKRQSTSATPLEYDETENETKGLTAEEVALPSRTAVSGQSLADQIWDSVVSADKDPVSLTAVEPAVESDNPVEFQINTKKGKKAKKKKGSGTATPFEDEVITNPITIVTNEEPEVVQGVEVSETPDPTQIVDTHAPSQDAVEEVDEWSGVTSGTKSKKDKKKRSKSGTPLEQGSAVEISENVAREEPKDASDLNTSDSTAREIPSEDINMIGPVNEAPVDEGQEWSELTTGKKSKKDKKKKGRSAAEEFIDDGVPVESTIPTDPSRHEISGVTNDNVLDRETPQQTLPTKVDVHSAERLEDLATADVDEWSSFTTGKKSKKDKKKKSRNTMEDDFNRNPLMGPNKSFPDEDLATTNEEPVAKDSTPETSSASAEHGDDALDDEWGGYSTGKKSKKDKKKKGRGAIADSLFDSAVVSSNENPSNENSAAINEDSFAKDVPLDMPPTEVDTSEHIDEVPAEAASLNESAFPTDDTPDDKAPIDESSINESPIKLVPTNETPITGPPDDNVPINEAPFRELPGDKTIMDKSSVDEAPVNTSPAVEDGGEWPGFTTSKKSKKDKKKKGRSIPGTPLSSEATFVPEASLPTETSEPLHVSDRDFPSQETNDDQLATEPPALENDDPFSFTTSKKSKKDKKKKGRSAEESKLDDKVLDELQDQESTQQLEVSRDIDRDTPIENNEALIEGNDDWSGFTKGKQSKKDKKKSRATPTAEVEDQATAEPVPSTPGPGIITEDDSEKATTQDIIRQDSQTTVAVPADEIEEWSGFTTDKKSKKAKKKNRDESQNDMVESSSSTIGTSIPELPTMTIEEITSPSSADKVAEDDGLASKIKIIEAQPDKPRSIHGDEDQDMEPILQDSQSNSVVEDKEARKAIDTDNSEFTPLYAEVSPDLNVQKEVSPATSEPPNDKLSEGLVVAAATGIAIAGGALLSKSPENSSQEATREISKDMYATQSAEDAAAATASEPLRSNSKKGKKGKGKGKAKIVDRRSDSQDDIFDDPSLWEGAEPRQLETDKNGHDADDGGDFWSAPIEGETHVVEGPDLGASSEEHIDAQTEKGIHFGREIPQSKEKSRQVSQLREIFEKESPQVRETSRVVPQIREDHKRQEAPQPREEARELPQLHEVSTTREIPQTRGINDLITDVTEPGHKRAHDEVLDAELVAAGIHSSAAINEVLEKTAISGKSYQSGEVKAEQQWNDLPADVLTKPSKKSKKNKKQSRLAAWDTPTEEMDTTATERPTDTDPQTASLPSRHEAQQFEHGLSKSLITESKREVATESSGTMYQPEHRTESQRTHNQEKSIQALPTTPENRSYDNVRGHDIRWATPTPLPVVLEEESPENPRFVKTSPEPEKRLRDQSQQDINRDSGLVTGSPIPRQLSVFTDDNDHIRDSGVHLKEWTDPSPSRAPRPVTSTDEALARMSWPAVDEDSETVDLDRSQRSHDHSPKQSPKGNALGAAAALAGAGVVVKGARSVSDKLNRDNEYDKKSIAQRRSVSPSIERLQTPEYNKIRPSSVGSNRSNASGTPPLRRSDRKLSGDLRSLSQRSGSNLAKEAKEAKESAQEAERSPATSIVSSNPIANEGRVRAKDMADVYDGFGEGRIGSPRSPTRPHSMRRRQSMQVLDLEARLEQLAAENRLLAEAKTFAEQSLHASQRAASVLADREAEVDNLKRTIDWLHKEVEKLKEVNDGLSSANITLGQQHNTLYNTLATQHEQTSRELDEMRTAHGSLSTGMESIVRNEVETATREKDREIEQLRQELQAAKEQIREMQKQILASKANDSDFLVVRDEDYFDTACQELCQHVQQWVLRFSKFSDMRACRLTSEINNDKIIDRLDNAVLDGSDVDNYLSDRVKRRDIFMSMTMTMIWEFVFTRYLFGMDREQRQKLKALEKTLSEVGPPSAVHQWRATTLTLLAKRDAFVQQREQDTEAVVQLVFSTLSEILPPPSHMEEQIQEQLRRVMKAAVNLSIEMRTQRAEYMMLPPLQPEYDANGDLAQQVFFNAALMNERSGDTSSNEDLEAQQAVVRVVLFPLVVKKGDDSGEGDDEIVVCPAQVLVAKPKKHVRVFSPDRMDMSQNHSRVSMQSGMPSEHHVQDI